MAVSKLCKVSLLQCLLLALSAVWTAFARTEARDALFIEPSKADQAYLTGSNFFVTCFSPGQTPLVWLAPDGSLVTATEGRIRTRVSEFRNEITSAQLVIDDARKTDSGTWTCRQRDGNQKASFKLYVYKTVEFVNTPSVQKGTLNGRFTLECSVKAEGKPYIYWERNNRQLRGVNFTKEGKIEFEKLQRSDAGNYTCCAFLSNPHISVVEKKHITLTVQFAAQHGERLRTDTYGTLNSSAKLECDFEGEPRPHVNWFRRGQRLINDTIHTIHEYPTSSVLTVKIQHRSQFDVYQCKVDNGLGNFDWEIALKEGELPRPPAVSVLNANDDTLVLQIEHPNPTNVEGFRVQYKTHGGHWKNAQTKEYDRKHGLPHYELKSLNTNTTYVLRAAAKNKHGYGEYSNELRHQIVKQSAAYTSGATCRTIQITMLGMIMLLLR